MFVTGVVGTEPKETFLSNGHYVLNFAVATVGHYFPVHEWEKFKPTETMWLSTEIWDDEAKAAVEDGSLRKGAKIAGSGTLIFNKWTDKATGEERKMFKFRMLKLMEREELEQLGFTKDNEGERKQHVSFKTIDTFPDIETQVPSKRAPTQSRAAVPSNVWPKPKVAPQKKQMDNFEGIEEEEDFDRDPRIPF
jgi:single-stranded DNA-binding protein